MKRTLIASSLMLVAVFAVAARQDETFSLKYRLDAPQKDSFRYEMKMTNSVGTPMGDMDMNMGMQMQIDLEIEPTRDGKATLKVTTSNMKMEMDSPMGGGAPMDLPNKIVMTGVMDALGNVSDVKYEGVDATMARMMGPASNYMVTFPDKPVKIGETWTFKVPANQATGIKESTMSARIKGIETYREKRAFAIETGGDMEMDSTGPLMEGLPDMRMRGTTRVVGTYYYEVETMRLLGFEGELAMRQTIELPEMAMTMNSTGRGTVRMVPIAR